jgi:periplasmic divalent cation tolerance protein
MTDKIVVLTTAGSHEEARRIAETLVEKRCAACVNVIKGVESIYRWKGKTEESEEWVLLIKTTKDAFDQVRDAIKAMHSYELPECLSIAVDEGSAEYLKWIDESVGGKS